MRRNFNLNDLNEEIFQKLTDNINQESIENNQNQAPDAQHHHYPQPNQN